MAGDAFLGPARWSTHVSRWESSPPILDSERFLDWLLGFGSRQPGHVLYPTCDDLAWLFAEHADALGRVFLLYQPGVETMLRLLDKKALYETCSEVGLPTLRTAFPEGSDDALRAAEDVGFPLLLKPRTQVYLETRSKGVVVDSPKDLKFEYTDFLAKNPFHARLRANIPSIERPMLQAFRPEAAGTIYSISGFMGRSDQGVAARAAVKVLQRPRRLGVGLCFEEAAIDPSALDGITRLCRKVGYFGVFEAEFVNVDGRLHLIDFNPRFYGQMGFEVARDLPLGYLTWLGALGQNTRLAEVLSSARDWQDGRGYVYCNRFFFNQMLSLQRFSGWMKPEEVEGWRRWLAQPSGRGLAFDSVDAPDDHRPALAAAVRDIYFALRHPRSFYRQMIVGP